MDEPTFEIGDIVQEELRNGMRHVLLLDKITECYVFLGLVLETGQTLRFSVGPEFNSPIRKIA